MDHQGTQTERRRPPAVSRPQPVGVFPLPAGFLLVPGGEETAPLRRALAAGRLPDRWPDGPPELAAIGHAYRGDVDAALALLTGDDPVSRYNRLVLGGDPGELAGDLAAAFGDELGALVETARFTLGLRDDPPPLTGGLTGEIEALVCSAHATAAIAAGRPADALALLDRGAAAAREPAPGLAALIRAARAELRRQTDGPSPVVIAELEAALAALAPTDLAIGRAELHLGLGSAYQEQAAGAGNPAALQAAARHYLSALRLVDAGSAPELYAAAQVNLATAYLAMPMSQASDQLRIGVAIQGLRAALRVYTPETHPARWASAQLNLAGALVYAPSAHRADNLAEAVERYAAVLAVRDRDTDPLGYARALAGQGNALAHLGDFTRARPVLHEAWTLFKEFDDHDGMTAVREVLDEIARQAALARPA
ncbi:MAG: hypothetical protein IRZ08_01265 [Frankia sp.]|nr:hypothetical protein [Frankia sp.]